MNLSPGASLDGFQTLLSNISSFHRYLGEFYEATLEGHVREECGRTGGRRLEVLFWDRLTSLVTDHHGRWKVVN